MTLIRDAVVDVVFGAASRNQAKVQPAGKSSVVQEQRTDNADRSI